MSKNKNVPHLQTINCQVMKASPKGEDKFIPYQSQEADLNSLRELYGLTEKEYNFCVDKNVSYAFKLENPVSELLDEMDYIRSQKLGFKALNDETIAAEYKIIQPKLFSEYNEFAKLFTDKTKKYEDAAFAAYYQARHLDICPSGAKAQAEGVVIEGEHKRGRVNIFLGATLSGLAFLGVCFAGFGSWCANKHANDTHQKIDNEAKLIQKAQIEKAQNTR